MSDDRSSISAHYDSAADAYFRQYRREYLVDSTAYPANYLRLQTLTTRLASLGAHRVFDIGAGEATPLVVLAKMGVEVGGCDISEQMVAHARRNFAEAGLAEELIGWADAEDSTTMAPYVARGPYDAVIAAGVLPHIGNERAFLDNVAMLLTPGGTCFIEFRNKLFSLFTFNRYTKEFILDDLLGDRSTEIRTAVEADLNGRLALDLPRPREELDSGAPGYDAILSKFHNPFELLRLFAQAGFGRCRIHWYHYHAAPPQLEDALGGCFRRESLAMEHDPEDWRGYFLCSAGIVEAARA